MDTIILALLGVIVLLLLYVAFLQSRLASVTRTAFTFIPQQVENTSSGGEFGLIVLLILAVIALLVLIF